MVSIAITITDKITPLAIISWFNFKRTPKRSKLITEPNVINLPKAPCDSKIAKPVFIS